MPGDTGQVRDSVVEVAADRGRHSFSRKRVHRGQKVAVAVRWYNVVRTGPPDGGGIQVHVHVHVVMVSTLCSDRGRAAGIAALRVPGWTRLVGGGPVAGVLGLGRAFVLGGIYRGRRLLVDGGEGRIRLGLQLWSGRRG